ncbi:MAG: DNA adenine methylase [Chloroflexi bacterium]|nr:DNA adenine methylase [Chloroflexota bacterium]MCY3589710.1 DNA adenine methylase [Chloroflexota bacterium]MCY3685139.1 DNA adenine methylase [Chloroflexota bacterium]MDE2707793.1 DNA adenine methylase [Chloroflexota bacterium]
MAKPFLKWAGGKTSLLPELLQAAPDEIETYYEPFVGGGALFFALQSAGRFKRAVLSDSNKELINAYVQVRDDVDGLVRALSVHQRKYRESEDRAEYYYTIRAKELTCSLGGAANLIFLNKTCYNGLYRVNSKGRFNVPHGRYVNPTICDEGNLRAASEALRGVELRVGDFADGPRLAGAGDFVYFDPPYVPLSETAYFTSYTAKEFGMDEQERLANTAARLVNQGSCVALSNSGHQDVASMYSSEIFELGEVHARRAINSKAKSRGPVREYLIQSG